MPASRLPYHPLIDISPEVVDLDSCSRPEPAGLDCPERPGRIPYFPDGVAFPGSGEEDGRCGDTPGSTRRP